MRHTGKLKNKISVCWQGLLDYIFPRECFGCGQEGEYLCSSCFDSIEIFRELPCFICNAGNHPEGICPDCSRRTQIDRIIVATTYSNNLVGKMIEAFKYDFLEDLKSALVKILSRQIEQKQLANIFWGAILQPIPLHPKRLAERGFNQAAEIARGICLKYNCVLEDSLLRRVKNTSQQAKLNRQQRLANMEEAFNLDIGKTVPQKIILLDDVLTTGATFCEAAQVLKHFGARQVICAAIAHG